MVVAIIPARSGSKGVKDKNIRPLAGKPLMAYSIEQALQCSSIDRVVVSTDSEEYAEVARSYGAQVPFLRPVEFAGDHSTDIEVFTHALNWMEENEGGIPDICVHLRPTHPLRRVQDIDAMLEILKNTPNADSIRSVTKAKENPYKMWVWGENGILSPIVSTIPECYNMPRQVLPTAYFQTANIDIVYSRTILQDHSMTGKNILGYEMSASYDIDTEEDFQYVERILKLQSALSGRVKIKLCFDIDGVLAHLVPQNDYHCSTPNMHMIQFVNRLYDAGNHITLFTARGSATGINWQDLTRRQIQMWGIKYHQLLFGKPAADFYFDDHMFDLLDLGEIEDNEKF